MKKITIFVWVFFVAGLAHLLGQNPNESVYNTMARVGGGYYAQPAAPARQPWTGAEPPKGIAPYKAPPLFKTVEEVLQEVKDLPVTVVEVRPHDQYANNQYGRAYGYRYVNLGAVYSDVDPSLTLGSVLQTRFAHEWRVRGGRLLAPATGPGSAQLRTISAETSIGRNAGVWGNHTWDTASLEWELSYAIRQEKESTRGFDGSFWGALACLAGSLAGGLAGDIACTAGVALSGVQTLEQWHEVELVLFGQLVDARTRDIVFSGEGVGRVQMRTARLTSGLPRFEFRHHNSEPLAERAVLSLFDGPPELTEGEQELADVKAKLAVTKEAVRNAKELEKTEKELSKLLRDELARRQRRRS